MANSNVFAGVAGHFLVLLAVMLFSGVPQTHAWTARKLAAPTQSAARTFMASLPLNISVATPPELASDGRAYMYGLQDITVVFSRPVIALGSDFDSTNVINKVPFRLSCNFPGKTRWVTTSIVRYDPNERWPTDLVCDLVWNTGLKTYDGVKLQLGDVRVRRPLLSPSQAITSVNVVSELASNVTSGAWSSGAMMAGDKAPEVPPDGRVQLYFSYNVNLKMLQSALRLLVGHAAYGNLTSPSPKLAFTVRPCMSDAPWVPATAGSSLDVNATCAEVEVGPSLKPDTWYTLRLPAGTKYNSVSGPLTSNLDATFAGMRPFRVPFTGGIPGPEEVPYASGTLRRWDMFLPHGLAPGVTAAALASAVAVCQLAAATKTSPASCNALPFSLTLPSRTTARLSVPSVQPGGIYRVYVSASAAVKDGFGQPLQASATQIEMSDVPYQFSGPATGNPSLVVLEAGADPLSDWPYVTIAPPPKAYGWPAGGFPRSISSYPVDVTSNSSIVGLLTFIPSMNSYTQAGPDGLLGGPSSSLAVNTSLTTPGSGAGWSQVKFPLGSSALQVVYACCTPVNDWYSYPSTQVVLRTSLSLSVVQSGPILVAWVTDAATGGGSGPVAGADVSFYSLTYSGYYLNSDGTREMSYKLASCTTNSQGYCTIKLSEDQQNGRQLAALATSRASSTGPVRTALLPSSGWAASADSVQPYVATLALDRRVVEPGDSIKITGFVQQASLEGLSLAPKSLVVLTLSPGFNESYGGGTVATAKLSATTGTFHAEIAVPASARMNTYSFIVHIASPLTSSSSSASSASSSSSTSSSSSASSSSTSISSGAISSAAISSSAVSDVAAIPRFDSNDIGMPDPNPTSPDFTYLTSGSFVVSSPRAPTAELQLATDPWVTPTGVVAVNATAVSYIGASVGGSAISVTWNAGTLYGKLDLVTDAEGVAAGRIDLAATAATQGKGGVDAGSVSINVEWIGPTRERITKSAAVNIATGPARVTLSPSLYTDTPGVPFTLAVSLLSSADDSPLTDLPVTVTMRPAPASTAACATVATCTVFSGARWRPAANATSATPCRLALPCVGVFELEACADVPTGVSGGAATTPATATARVCGSMTLGRNASQWAAAPLSTHPSLELELDKPGGYRLGESPKLWLENPYSGARLLVVWGTSHGVRTQAFSQLPAGSGFTATIGPLGPECTTGCSVTALLDVPRLGPSDQPALPPPSQLPVATLFDPRAPHTIVLSTRLTVLPDNTLPVAVAVVVPGAAGAGAAGAVGTVKDASGASLAVVEPGASAQISVDVGAVAADGPVEVTVYAVDKAFLDLLPYDLPQPQQEMLLRTFSYMHTSTLDQYRIAPGSVRAVFDKLLARLSGLDPWLPTTTGVVPSGGLDAVDQSDDAFLAASTSWITSSGAYWSSDDYYNRDPSLNPMMPSMQSRAAPPPPPSRVSDGQIEMGDDSTAGSSGGGSSVPPTDATLPDTSPSDSLRRAGEFVVTPLFVHAPAGPTGRATFNFTAPQNLGAFVIRAFAAAGSSAKYGSAEGKLVVRRSLSLTPSVPAFVRVGDTFEAGVVVTLGSAPATVTLSLKVQGVAADASILAVGAVSRTVVFTAAGGLQQEVRFSFRARAVGTTTMVFSAADGSPGGGKDSLELEIPVEGQQGDVWVATSFALAANASTASSASGGRSSGWVEGMVLPGGVPGSGGLTLIAGVGYLPAISAMYDNLAITDAWRTEPYAQPAVLWAALPAVLSYYGQAVSGAQATQVSRAVSDLTALTTTTYGLSWNLPSKWANWWPNRADVYLNTWALLVASFYPSGASPSPSWSEVVSGLVPQWQHALEVQLVADVVQARSYNYTYSDWNTLARVRLALGADWVPSADAYADPITLATLSLNATLAAYRADASGWEFGRQTRILLSLVLLSMGRSNPEPQLVNSTLAEVTAALRVQGRTAYLAAWPGSASASSLEDQALALLLLLRTGATHQLVPKLATYLANPTASSGGLIYYYAPWSAQALAVAALTEYDRARGSSKPSLDLEAEVNGLTVLQASFRVGNTRPVTNTTAWEDMPPPPRGKPSKLDFAISGTGEVTVAASLHFVPSTLPTFPTYRGLFVDLALQLVDAATGRPTGPRVSSVPLGSVVALTVQLTTPDDLAAVTLSVMMPGGLEAMDPNLVPDAGSSCFTDWLGAWTWRSFYPRGWWWPVCPAQETRPSVVTFSYAALRAGTATATIKAVAATAGTFVVPPVRASVDEQPEVMGMTAAGSVTVCAGCASAVPAPPPRTPRPCLGDCSDNGLCNLRTGVCACDVGYSGADCSLEMA